MSRKRKKKGVSPILKDLADQVTAEGRIEKYVFNPKGEISMSDAISKLIEPYKQDAPDYNSFNNLVTFACIAWNTSILPAEKREKALQEMLRVLPGTLKDRQELHALVTELMERKRSLFPNVSRMIMEHKVTGPRSGKQSINCSGRRSQSPNSLTPGVSTTKPPPGSASNCADEGV